MYTHPMMVVTEQWDSIPGAHGVLTVDNTTGGVALPNIPPKARMVYLTLESANIRFTTDGTAPTALLGHIKTPTSDFFIAGRNEMKRFRAIRATGSDATLTYTYYGAA